MATGQPSVRPDRIMQLAWGYAPPLTIEAAVRFKVFDIVDQGAKTVEEVAAASGASVRGLRAIMNALTALQLLSKDAEGRYSTTPESSTFLVRGKPANMGDMMAHICHQVIPEWLRLGDVVGSGKPEHAVNEETTGSEFFHQFVEAIFPMSYPGASALAAALNIASLDKPASVLDLAAGSGVWGIALAQRSPMISVRAVDWPGVLDITRRVATRFGVADRFTFVAGDLQSADFGHGHKYATLGHILHSEGERRSRELLRKTFEALAPGGTIAIQEFLVDDERQSNLMGLIFAVNMLAVTQEGDTFTFNEIASWLREAGFENPRTLDAPGPSPLILADRR